MGICQSGEDTREAERNCQIDKQLEKDKVKQEYKILLLGDIVYNFFFKLCLIIFFRKWGVWEINHIEANENYKSKWIFKRWAEILESYCI